MSGRLPRAMIKKVFDKHQYSIDSIVFDVMQTFKLNSIVRHTRFEKQEGYPVTEVLALLIMFPLMMLSSVNRFFHSEFHAITTMKKDTVYRLKNHEGIPWRTILYGIAKRFQKIVNRSWRPMRRSSSTTPLTAGSVGASKTSRMSPIM